MEAKPSQTHEAAGYGKIWQKLHGLLIAQGFGQFNDQGWKQVVTLLAMAGVVGEAAKIEKTAIAQIALMLPLPLFSLPAGLLADRLSKRTLIVAMKAFELALMLAGAAALVIQPKGGWLAMGVLFLIGIQTALFIPAKYGILPELLPEEDISEGNGLLETISNLTMLAGLVCGGLIFNQVGKHTYLAPFLLSVLSAMGLLAALKIPRLKPARSEGGLVDHDPDRVGSDHGRPRAGAGDHRTDLRLDHGDTRAASDHGL